MFAALIIIGVVALAVVALFNGPGGQEFAFRYRNYMRLTKEGWHDSEAQAEVNRLVKEYKERNGGVM